MSVFKDTGDDILISDDRIVGSLVALTMGVQLIQTKRADRNTAMFMEMMQNQVVFLIQPSVTCSSVTPNDVLHQTLVMMEKVATMLVGSIIFS